MKAGTFTTSTGAEYPMPCKPSFAWTPNPRERRFVLLRIYRQAVSQLNNAQIGVTRIP
jgi:hypothetical protein